MSEPKRILLVSNNDMKTEAQIFKYAGYDVHCVNADGAIALLCGEEKEIEEDKKEFDVIISRMLMSHSAAKLEFSKETTGALLAKYLQDHKVKIPFIIYDSEDCLRDFTHKNGVLNLGDDLKTPVIFFETFKYHGSEAFSGCVDNILENYEQETNEPETKKQVLFVVTDSDKEHILKNYDFDDTGYEVHFAGNSDVYPVDNAIDMLVNKKREFDLIVSNMAMPHDRINFTSNYTSCGNYTGIAFAEYLQDEDMLNAPFIFFGALDYFSKNPYYNAEKGVVNFLDKFEIPVALQGKAEKTTSLIDHMDDALGIKTSLSPKNKVLFVVHSEEDKFTNEVRWFEDDGYEVCFAGDAFALPVNDAIERIVYGGEKFDIIVSDIALYCNERYLKAEDTLDGDNAGPAFATYLYEHDVDIPLILYSAPSLLLCCEGSYDMERDVVTLPDGAEIPFVFKGRYGDLVNKANDLLSGDSETLELDFAELTF